MLLPRVGVRKAFEQDVPKDFIGEWLRLLVGCFKRARDTGTILFSPEMAHDEVPHILRGFVNDGLYQLVSQLGGEPRRMKNVAENCTHTQGVFNGRTLMTAHAVRKRRELPDAFVFRALAREAAQLRFAFMDPVPFQDGAPGIYAQLLYGLAERKTGFPGFARIVFPTEDGKIVDSMDLTMRLTELLYRRHREAVIADELPLGLLPHVESKEKKKEEIITDELPLGMLPQPEPQKKPATELEKKAQSDV